ncbi:MAG: hypothetical protein MUF54_15640 [Polyangiaceae bacterium]|nr:hypothetical protein [Polyangiaceae bacterium]
MHKLLVNGATRALARNAGILGTRQVLLHSLIPLVAPPWKRRQMRQRVRGYLHRYFPEHDTRTVNLLASRYVHHWCCKHAEDVYVINVPDLHVALGEVDRFVVHEHAQRFQEALSHRRGVLAVGAHVGALTFGTVALLSRLRETTAEERGIVRICMDPELKHYPNMFAGAEQALADFGRDIRYVVTHRESRAIATDMGDALERGALVTTNLDVLVGGDNQLPLELFGAVRVRLPALVGAAKVALRTGAVVLPWVCTRTRGGFRLRLERPLGPFPRMAAAIRDDDPELLGLTERLVDVLQGWIRWHPEQWVYWDRLNRRLAS